MYLTILKKDLKRKKAMNIILLVFIILATMFVSSSVNNIISVTTALDDYLEMADAPDYLIMTIDKTVTSDIDEIMDSATSIERYEKEQVLFMAADHIHFEDASLQALTGTNMLQSDKDLAANYFLSDGSILESVEPGELSITAGKAEDIGVELGEKVTSTVDDICCEYTFAGTMKDACLGSNMNNMTRYIISGTDFERFTSNEAVAVDYCGKLYYIYTDDLDTTISELSVASENFGFAGDKSLLKFTYIFDMMITGILLVISAILIAVAFVVLRFTIVFTISEEFREIGVMKAIGISNSRIRGLYLVKYMGLSVLGAMIGLAFSFPFGELIMRLSAMTIIIKNQNPVLVNFLCAMMVIAVILLFCYGCTGRVKKMTPIDAIRNGQTGERFRKKSLISLGKSRIAATSFLAVNDIISAPKRYSIITLNFILCLSLLLILSNTVATMKSGSLITTFGMTDYDVSLPLDKEIMEYMQDGGDQTLEADLAEMEKTLAANGMPADCITEVLFVLPIEHKDKKTNITMMQGTGTTTDMYEYIEGDAPQNPDEVAITRISADKIDAEIGDTVTIKTYDGEKEFIITAYFQSMNNLGDGVRFHQDAELNYIEAQGGTGVQVIFQDDPDDAEIQRRAEKIESLYSKKVDVTTCKEDVAQMLGVTKTLDSIKSMIVILTIVLTTLITVLMERSFIAKEQGEIALMKAIGTRSSRIYVYHALRFAIVGIVAIMIGEILAMPLTQLCIDPVFKMMGLETGVKYTINPAEMFGLFPLVILVTTTVSAYLTALYTRKIKSSDTANIE